ncbi:hypothetical protein IF2G_05785 [Cordyceps javanica]|nr:hypothetical protein IF2G_05785 [Cordyceps javanica]
MEPHCRSGQPTTGVRRLQGYNSPPDSLIHALGTIHEPGNADLGARGAIDFWVPSPAEPVYDMMAQTKPTRKDFGCPSDVAILTEP